MKVLHVYNQREVWGGEDYMVESSVEILRRQGVDVDTWVVRNADHLRGLKGKVRAFVSGIYSVSMAIEMSRRLKLSRPDVVHAHNLYPLLSPSVLAVCSLAGVPVVVHCHNHFISCPVGSHLRDGNVCERCTRGSVFFCVLHNCRGRMLESIGYALRSGAARWFGWFRRNATIMIVLSDFARKRMAHAGFPDDQLATLPNMVSVPDHDAGRPEGRYIIYAGRLSPEKGISTLLEAASLLPDIEFRIAGDGPLRAVLESCAPPNVRFEGWINKADLSALYREARLAVVPSICYETFGLSAADAMAHGLPVIASRLGALPEVIDHMLTGVLFEPGDTQDLAAKIRTLWDDLEIVHRMGSEGSRKVIREYSTEVYFHRLMAIYQSAITQIGKPGNG